MTDLLFALSIGILFGIGVFQLLRRDLIKAAIGFAILFSAINLFFVAVGAFEGDFALFPRHRGEPPLGGGNVWCRFPGVFEGEGKG